MSNFLKHSSSIPLSIIPFLLCAIVGNGILAVHLAQANRLDHAGHGGGASCEAYDDDDGACNDEDILLSHQHQQAHRMPPPPPLQDSKLCHSSSQQQQPLPSIEEFYRRGISAQAYKANAPIKTHVCQVPPQKSGEPIHTNVAHRSLWRSNYRDVVPLVVRGNIYSCGSPPPSPTAELSSSPSSSSDAMTMEVWQPRPDGTFSSLRPGNEEGECRATVPITAGPNNNNNNGYNVSSNILGEVQFETLVPGSPGALGGLVPISSGEYPPYGPGAIHLFLDIEGHYPLLGQLYTNELEVDWTPQQKDDSNRGRFRFKGWDMRPHSTERTKRTDGIGGIEIRSVTKVSHSGYDFALEVEIDVFIVPVRGSEMMGDAREKKSNARDVFCSRNGYFNWMSSFFKEPIAICFPSLLDFFAL